MTSINEKFRYTMGCAGLETNDPIVADGRLHRFHVLGDRSGTKNGWYILYADFPAVGVYGCWKRHIRIKWHPVKDSNLTTSDSRVLIERKQIMHKQTVCAFRDQYEALQGGAEIWQNAPSASDRHGYLMYKGVNSHGLRYHEGALLVPVTDPDGNFHGMQRIWPNGAKRFIRGTLITGHFFVIGEGRDTPLLICEGYSTGATLHETSGYTVFVTFGSENLCPAAQAVRTAWPNSRIIICADDDHTVPGNPGLSAAVAATAQIDAELAVPVFPSNRGAADSDFNDLKRLAGTTAVLKCLECQGGYHANV